MRNIRKGVAYFLAIINMLIIMTITNNDLLLDFILLIVFIFNAYIIYKYDHKYINIGENDYD